MMLEHVDPPETVGAQRLTLSSFFWPHESRNVRFDSVKHQNGSGALPVPSVCLSGNGPDSARCVDRQLPGVRQCSGKCFQRGDVYAPPHPFG